MKMGYLIGITGAIGVGWAYWYYNIACPDPNMVRENGDCVCKDNYFPNPEDNDACLSNVEEAKGKKGILIDGVYHPHPKGEDLLKLIREDTTGEIVIDCMMCKSLGQKQAKDGRCLKCQQTNVQSKYLHETDPSQSWVDEYNSQYAPKTVSRPPPITSDYSWD
jgi:hypothetical protein